MDIVALIAAFFEILADLPGRRVTVKERYEMKKKVRVNEMTTKKAPSKRRKSEMQSEYRFDYAKSRTNRFAKRMRDTVAVVLEPDVASVFKTSASVNRELRRALKDRTTPKKRAG